MFCKDCVHLEYIHSHGRVSGMCRHSNPTWVRDPSSSINGCPRFYKREENSPTCESWTKLAVQAFCKDEVNVDSDFCRKVRKLARKMFDEVYERG